MKLAGKAALVTGASSGMGKAVAVALAKEGAKITAAARNFERLAELKNKITAAGGECLTVQADLTRVSEAEKVVKAALEKFGKLDVLVNCAGIFELSDFLEISEEFYEKTMQTNIKSVFFMCQKAAAEMKKQGRGKIINFASIAGGKIAFPTGSVYCASKAAIVALTHTLALELAPYKITVNAVSPGNIRTPMNEQLLTNPEYLKAMLAMTPLERIGETSDIAPAVVYLASDDSDYMTGHQLVIDGGVSNH